MVIVWWFQLCVGTVKKTQRVTTDERKGLPELAGAGVLTEEGPEDGVRCREVLRTRIAIRETHNQHHQGALFTCGRGSLGLFFWNSRVVTNSTSQTSNFELCCITCHMPQRVNTCS